MAQFKANSGIRLALLALNVLALPVIAQPAASTAPPATASTAPQAAQPLPAKTEYIPPIPPEVPDHAVPIQFDLGVFGGATLFSTKTRLGLAHSPNDVPGNSGEFGVRAAWVGVDRHLGAEVEFRDAFYQLRSKYAHGQVLGIRGQAWWNFLPEARVQPFVLLGLGDETLLNSLPTCPSNLPPTPKCLAIKTPHSIFTGILGAGLRIPLTYRLAARIDAHWLVQQGRAGDPTANPPAASTAFSSNWEFQGGLSWTLGGAPEDSDKDGIPDDFDKCPNDPEDKDGFEDADGCPDPDNDGDGLPDDQDKCPNQAEDKDGFEDTDGCPDPDNDRDGIPDAQDKCPNQPETRNGYQDDDGCPDVADSDGDGIPEDKDKCPKEKEDKDGFEDEDGCPDPDNDKDGIPDVKDKCPNQPETRNGVQDDDGCPDSLPPAAQKLLDSPVTLAFQGNKLAPGADDVFDPLLELLLEHENVKMGVEVAAETDDAAGKSIAQSRALAVRAALEAKGIDPMRITATDGPVVPVSAPPEVKSKKKAKKSKIPAILTVMRPVSLRIL